MIPPKEVIKAAGELVELYGSRFKYLGKLEDEDVFMFCFPDNEKTGYPFIYLYAVDGYVKEINGEECFDIIQTCRRIRRIQ